MKINGKKIRTYQGGELINFETECSYSESLGFVAVRVNKDMDIERSSSKHIEIKYDKDILFGCEFKFMDVITDADNECLTTDLLIFHNGNIGIVLDYLNIGVLDNINRRFRHLERMLTISNENPRKVIDELIESFEVFKSTIQMKNENKIQKWVGWIFGDN